MPSKNSIFATIGNWFSREPVVPVAVAAFGKSAVVNGHQDLAGDATKSLLEFARMTYYEGALPNCTAWEAQLRDAERVLTTHIVRWCEGRLTVARISAVAEGGATEKAFAPMVTCAEVDGAFGLRALPLIDAALEGVATSLLSARPDTWASILAPTRAALLEEFGRTASRTASGGHEMSSSAVLPPFLARLGSTSAAWVESLAEELDLEMPATASSTPPPLPPRGGAIAVRSRRTDAPRTGVDLATDLRGWGSFLRASGPNHPEWWLFGGSDVQSIHVVVGRPHERDFAMLWRSVEQASAVPEPLPESGRARVLVRTGTWIARATAEPKPPSAVVPVHAPAPQAAIDPASQAADVGDTKNQRSAPSEGTDDARA
jgi:hypothetical protein